MCYHKVQATGERVRPLFGADLGKEKRNVNSPICVTTEISLRNTTKKSLCPFRGRSLKNIAHGIVMDIENVQMMSMMRRQFLKEI